MKSFPGIKNEHTNLLIGTLLLRRDIKISFRCSNRIGNNETNEKMYVLKISVWYVEDDVMS